MTVAKASRGCQTGQDWGSQPAHVRSLAWVWQQQKQPDKQAVAGPLHQQAQKQLSAERPSSSARGKVQSWHQSPLEPAFISQGTD